MVVGRGGLRPPFFLLQSNLAACGLVLAQPGHKPGQHFFAGRLQSIRWIENNQVTAHKAKPIGTRSPDLKAKVQTLLDGQRKGLAHQSFDFESRNNRHP